MTYFSNPFPRFPQCGQNRCLTKFASWFIMPLIIIVFPALAMAASKEDVANSALEFGASFGKLLYGSMVNDTTQTKIEADPYTRLAAKAKSELAEGRTSSALIANNFKLIGALVSVGAAKATPDPRGAVAIGLVGAWAAKKLGDAFEESIMRDTQKRVNSIVAQGLKEAGLKPQDWQGLTKEQLRTKVADLKIGGRKLRDELAGNAEALQMVQAHTVDIVMDMGLETLFRTQDIAVGVEKIKEDAANIRKYQVEMKERLSKIETHMSKVQAATLEANNKLDDLRERVKDQSKAIRTLSEISYSGWSTTQKLQAVRSGMFPDLSSAEKIALVKSLEATSRQEQLISDTQQAAQDFGNLAAIAQNLGLSKDTVVAFQAAQTIATGVVKFATGDYLGTIASVTSLAGLGGTDAAAARDAAMRQFLEEKFAEVNQKLEKVIGLQIKTYEAIERLTRFQIQFRVEVLSQLDRIEGAVLRNEVLLKTLLMNQWDKCGALISKQLNGIYDIPSLQTLVDIVKDKIATGRVQECYIKLADFFDSHVLTAQWSGQVISAKNFPTSDIKGENLQKQLAIFVSQRVAAYENTRDFVLKVLPEAGKAPAYHLISFSQPVINANDSRALSAYLDSDPIQQQFKSFRCGQKEVLSIGLHDLICYRSGDTEPPRPDRWGVLLEAPLIGPHAFSLIDTGIIVSGLSDLAIQDATGAFQFSPPEAISNFSENGPTNELMNGLREAKGYQLLIKLKWLAEASLFQQGLAYGDYTARLVEGALYDPASRSLEPDPARLTELQREIRLAALRALQANPILARNVVMLAMRHSLEDALGGPDRADALLYQQPYYQLALADFSGSLACDDSAGGKDKLLELFPNWKFEYRVTISQKEKRPELKNCPEEPGIDPNKPTVTHGIGISVPLGDFYVKVPDPLTLSSGIFEQNDSLREAIEYRNAVSYAMTDKKMASAIEIAAKDQQMSRALAFQLLNEGWGWQSRKLTRQAGLPNVRQITKKAEAKRKSVVSGIK